MDLALTDKTVLITGASGGIGRALARVFADEGAALALHGHSRFDELVAWTAAQPWADRACCLRADISDPDAVGAMFDQARTKLGSVRICVANAGVWPRADVHLAALDPARVQHTVAVNLLGATWTARSFLAGLPTDGDGPALTFIGSTAGRFGERGHADYALAKAGLVGLVHTLKNEIVHTHPFGRVNMVEPGWTVTEMARAELSAPGNVAAALRTMPMRQLARAVDIARSVAVLSSPTASRHISGQIVTVAGGMEGRVQWSSDDIDEAAVRARARRGN